MENLYKPENKIESVLMQLVLYYRHIEKSGENGIKAFLKDNREKVYGYKFKSETILGIKKAIINYNDDFEIKIV